MSLRNFIFYLLLLCFSTSCGSEENELVSETDKNKEENIVAPIISIIAHRGCWSGDSLPQNSLASFKKALRQNIFGTEFDVHQTSDGQLVINHDATFYDMTISKSTYKELCKHHLTNGETIPLLEDFLKTYITIDTHVQMIVELKSCNVDDLLSLLKKYELLSSAIFISFSKVLCNQLVKRGYGSVTYYLNSDLAPHEISRLGYGGIDFSHTVYESNPTWIDEARSLGLKVGVWTVNNLNIVNAYLADSVLVTTDKVMNVLQEQR